MVLTLAKNKELTINFSYNEENMEQVPISQSLEIENNKNAHMEKGFPYEDNYGEKEVKMTRREYAVLQTLPYTKLLLQ